MSAVLRDRVYRINGWGTTCDWVVTRRERDGNVHLSSQLLGTTISVHESKIEQVVADRNESLSLFLATADPGLHGSGSALSARALSTSSGESRGHPLARNTDPQTAHDAAHVARSNTAQNRMRVLLAHHVASDRGLTGDELAAVCNAPYSQIGPRRPGLVTDGLIYATSVRRPSNLGVMQAVYAITEAGRVIAERAVA